MFLPIFLAAIVSFAVGALWYGPLFGKYWMGLMNFTPDSVKSMSMTPARAMSIGFVVQVVFAFVLGQFVSALGVVTLYGALMLAVWIWLGFYVTTTIGGYLWEGKSFKLFAFNAAYQLVGLLVTAAVLVSLL